MSPISFGLEEASANGGKLLGLVEQIYAAATEGPDLEPAVRAIMRAFEGDVACLVLHDPAAPEAARSVWLGIERPFQTSYLELAANDDMRGIWSAVAGNPLLRAIHDQAPLVDGYQHTRMDREWLRPQRIHRFAMVLLPLFPRTASFLAIDRTTASSGLSRRELTPLDLFQPHLVRACRLRLQLDEGAAWQGCLARALDHLDDAVLLLDSPAASTTRTRRRISCAARTGSSRSTVGAAAAGARRVRRCTVGSRPPRRAPPAGEDGMLAVRRADGRPLALLVAPLRGERVGTVAAAGRVVVVVKDPDRVAPAPVELLRRAYGLTAAEARVGAGLLDADRLQDVADRLRIGRETARSHLQWAFDKTGTRRQAELVRLILATSPPRGRPVAATRPAAPAR